MIKVLYLFKIIEIFHNLACVIIGQLLIEASC